MYEEVLFVDYVTLIVALAALVLVWLTNRRLTSLEARLARDSSRLYEIRSAISELNERLDRETADIRFDIRRRSGEIHFSPTMTIGEISSVHPAVPAVLAGFHLGGCHSCAVGPDEVLGEVCVARGIDQETLLGALNRLGSGGAVELPETTHRANVQLIM